MEYAISVEDGRVPIITELVTCGNCRWREFNASSCENRCQLRGVIRPVVKLGDFCSWGERK